MAAKLRVRADVARVFKLAQKWRTAPAHRKWVARKLRAKKRLMGSQALRKRLRELPKKSWPFI